MMLDHAKGTATKWCTRHRAYDGNSCFLRLGKASTVSDEMADAMGVMRTKIIENMTVMIAVSLIRLGRTSIPVVAIDKGGGLDKKVQYAPPSRIISEQSHGCCNTLNCFTSMTNQNLAGSGQVKIY